MTKSKIDKNTRQTKQTKQTKRTKSPNHDNKIMIDNDCGCVVQSEDGSRHDTQERSLEHFIHEYLTQKYIKSSSSSSSSFHK